MKTLVSLSKSARAWLTQEIRSVVPTALSLDELHDLLMVNTRGVSTIPETLESNHLRRVIHFCVAFSLPDSVADELSQKIANCNFISLQAYANKIQSEAEMALEVAMCEQRTE